MENFNWSHILELELVYWHGYHISIPKWCGCVVWPDSGHCIMTAYLQCISAWLWWGSFMVRRRRTWSGRALAPASRQPPSPAGWRTSMASIHGSAKATKIELWYLNEIPLQMSPKDMWGPENMKIKKFRWGLFEFYIFLY